jgi:hypothetical protein
VKYTYFLRSRLVFFDFFCRRFLLPPILGGSLGSDSFCAGTAGFAKGFKLDKVSVIP